MTLDARTAAILATDAQLLAQCEVDRYRASGPGGQHRNKTESAVRLRHKPTAVSAIGEDSRSQHENKYAALRRLRTHLALQLREPITIEGFVPSPMLAGMLAKGTQPLGAKTRQTPPYWASMAQLLDVFVAHGGEVATTAATLGLSTGALSKMLMHDELVARVVNDERRRLGLRPLR